MEKLTIQHIESLIEKEEYVVEVQYVQCILHVGEAPVIGTSYRFSKSTHNPEYAKKAAREDAIRQLFSLEAYHQKRLRGGMGKCYAESTADDAKEISLDLGNPLNPFEGMAKRDVPLMYGGVNCQEALAEYVEGLNDQTQEAVLAQAGALADLCNRTVLKQPSTVLVPTDSKPEEETGGLFNQRNKTL